MTLSNIAMVKVFVYFINPRIPIVHQRTLLIRQNYFKVHVWAIIVYPHLMETVKKRNQPRYMTLVINDTIQIKSRSYLMIYHIHNIFFFVETRTLFLILHVLKYILCKGLLCNIIIIVNRDKKLPSHQPSV